MLSELQDKLFGELERVGFILPDGEVVEVKNVCEDPRNGFQVDAADLLDYALVAVATWHTHPNASKVLTVEDYTGFLNYPDLDHYIIGTDGVAKYVVKDGDVLIDE